MSADLSVVIPTAGRPDLLERTLRSLGQCGLPEGYRGVWVVENGAAAGARAVVGACRDELKARYLHVERPNKSHALNVALGRLESSLVVFLDDDVRVSPSLLEAYADAAGQNGAGHFFGGPMGVDYEEPPPDWLRRYLPPSAIGWEGNGSDPSEVMGCNWAAFVDDIHRVGPFTTDRGPGTSAVGQEHEMQARLARAGVRGRYVPDARVWHWVPRARCSPEWVLDRARRMGARNARGVPARPTDVLRWTGKWGAYWAVYRVRRALSLDPEERFRARLYQSLCEGSLTGLRKGRD